MSRKKVCLSLDEQLWYRFKRACAILDEVPSYGIDALMRAWLAHNEETARDYMQKE